MGLGGGPFVALPADVDGGSGEDGFRSSSDSARGQDFCRSDVVSGGSEEGAPDVEPRDGGSARAVAVAVAVAAVSSRHGS